MAGTRSLGSLTLDLIARVGGFTSGLSQAERETQRRVRGIQNTFRGLQRTIAGTFAALGGAALVRSIVRNTTETENALAQLNAALISTGGAAGYSRDQLVDMAQQMSASTTHSINEITRGQTRLLSYTTLVGETYPRALQAAIDQSVRLGISIEQSAEIIGRALETPSRGVASLTRQGFQFTEAQKSALRALEQAGRMAEAQAIVLDVLEESYGGAARAARDTFGGALAAVKNAFEDLLSGQGGLSEATSSLNEFADLLRDPATVSAANTLTSAIISGFKAAAEAITGTVNVTRFLAEEFAAFRAGAAADDIVRLREELEKFEELRASKVSEIFSWTGSEFLNRLRFFGKDGLVKWYSDEDLDREIARLKRQIEEATSGFRPVVPTATDGGTGGPVLPPPPSEEFLKLEARLKQQIALFGQVGEAARIAYQIQSGQLDDLTKAEQQRVLSLARQYDALVANANAEKELEASRKRLEDTLQNQIRAYEQQLALTGEITELDRIRYEIAHGGLKGIQADQAAYLESLAKQIDLEKQRADMQDRVKAIIEDTMTPLERYNKTIEELNKLREESIALLGEEGLSYETYARAVAKAQEELEKATHQTNEFMLEAARNTQNILADTLFDAMQGKITDVGKMFKQMLDRMVANAIAADLATKLFGNPESPSGGGGWVGAAFNWLGRFFGGGKASGGSVAGGMLYRVNENGVEGLSIPGSGDYLLMGNRSGTVIPNNQVGRRSIVNQNIYVQGRVDQRSARQLELEALRRQRLANARLG